MRHKKRGKAAKKARAALLSAANEEAMIKAPHSFIFHRGKVPKAIKHLVMDLRRVFAPYTATSLRVKKSNTLRDLVDTARALHVTHFLSFTQTEQAAYVRFMCTPTGPTLTFKIKEYCLSKDVLSQLKKPNVEQSVYQGPPLVVMNHLHGDNVVTKLIGTVFHNMLPAIDVCSVKLKNIRRTLLLSYDPESKTLELRHFLIRVAPVGISRATKKLLRPKLPDLSNFTRVDEFVEKGGNMSESEGEMDGPHNEVTVSDEVRGRGNVRASQSAIRLKEAGPRMTLELVKVEEGLADGAVLHHEYVTKTPDELTSLKARIEQKRRLRKRRQKEQNENIRKKQEAKEKHKQRCLKGMKKKDPQQDKDQVSSDDDAAYFKEEVGQDPDTDVLPRKRKRPVSKKGKQDGPVMKKKRRKF